MTVFEIVAVCIFAFFWLVCGFLSYDLHNRKGYSGGFLMGFLLGYIGLIYSAGLPDATSKRIVKTDENEELLIPEDEEKEEEIDPVNLPQKNECPACFAKISPSDTECPNCGYRLK